MSRRRSSRTCWQPFKVDFEPRDWPASGRRPSSRSRPHRTPGSEIARVTSDAKHIEIGLTDKSDSARWGLRRDRARGVEPGSCSSRATSSDQLGGLPGSDAFLLVPEALRATVISVGAEPSGTPEDVHALRRRPGPTSHACSPTSWIGGSAGTCPSSTATRAEGDHERRPRPAARAGGESVSARRWRLGSCRSSGLRAPSAAPGVVLVGACRGEGSSTALAPCRDWTRLQPTPRTPRRITRRLDLAAGLLREEGQITALRFSSLARPGTVALRAHAERTKIRRGRERGSAAVVATLHDRRRGQAFERLGSYDCEPSVAQAALADAKEAGFERLLREHREAWARRWREAEVVIEGDPELQRAVHFALFHLISSVGDRGEAAVGARGLSGACVQRARLLGQRCLRAAVPSRDPPGGRASDARVPNPPAARRPAAARALGRAGSRFAWESAADGRDVTPASARLTTGDLVRIRAGELEEHIVGDVAWAAVHYLAWTGDDAFATGAGASSFSRPLVIGPRGCASIRTGGRTFTA